MGIDPEAAMAPFLAPIDAFHERTKPSSWLEGLVKAYVGDGIATDFYREIAAYVDPSTQALVHSAMEDVGQADFVVEGRARGHQGRPADRRAAGAVGPPAGRRGALAGAAGGRRARRPGLPARRWRRRSDRPSADLAELGRMFARLTDEHTRRMGRLGLAA